jgi:serine/threonine protein kinase/Flp pilus assembly protein TadD
MTDLDKDAEAVFLAALDRATPAARAAYVEGACAGRPELLRRVRELLAAHDESRGPLDAPPAGPGGTADAPPPAGPAGTLIGPYKLLERIGEGGMGTVWMAQQTEPVRRLVAVKLIKAGMDSKQVIARFEAERQALALMDHPHIARVLDGGTTAAGRPYFVMDLVRGVPITRYCDEHRLTPRQRLELFIPVCQAVQHAHQKGVIHRDLKPSNVLVALYDGKPVPKVIDFGVAKAAGQPLTDKTLVTGFGAIIGTLEYMSPEQAEVNQLDVDTRSDIHSLGVLLYELLTGSPPFTKKNLEAAGLLETLRVIREQEPTRPSKKLSTAEGLAALAASRGTEPAKLTRLVRGELDWIVMKALEKDRARRYDTASAFAADVHRYLADEPVLACPPSAGYRFRKFARRNKGTLVSAALLGAMLLVVTGSFGWMARDRAALRGRNAEAIAALLDQCEDALRGGRADRAAIALEAAEGRAAEGVAGELAGRLDRGRADLELLRELDDIDKFRWTWIDGGFPDPKAVAARLRTALATDGLTPDEDRAVGAAGRLNGSPVRDRLLTALDLWLVHEPSEGVRAMLRAADPDPYRDAVRDALAAGHRPRAVVLAGRPDALAQPPGFATALVQLGGLSTDRQVAVLEGALRARPGNYALLMTLGNTYQQTALPAAALTHPASPLIMTPGITYQQTRREFVAERVRWFQAAVAAHPGSAVAHNSLAVALRDKGDRDGAAEEVREAVRLDPKYPHARNNLGLVLLKKGTLDGAVAELREAVRLDPKLAGARNSLGLALTQKGDVDGALAAYREALRLDPKYAGAHNNLAWLLAVGPDGVRDGERAVAHATRACELTGWQEPNFLDTLAAAYAEAGDFEKAVEYQKRALSVPDFEKEDGEGARDRLQRYARNKPYHQSASAPREVPPPPPPREVKP